MKRRRLGPDGRRLALGVALLAVLVAVWTGRLPIIVGDVVSIVAIVTLSVVARRRRSRQARPPAAPTGSPEARR